MLTDPLIERHIALVEKLCAQHGLSPSALAKKAGLNPATITNVMNGRTNNAFSARTLEALKKLENKEDTLSATHNDILKALEQVRSEYAEIWSTLTANQLKILVGKKLGIPEEYLRAPLQPPQVEYAPDDPPVPANHPLRSGDSGAADKGGKRQPPANGGKR